jgi:hypothetical protein
MTSENPDPPIKPQVIDLDAEDVIDEQESAPSTPLPPTPAKKSSVSAKWLVLALLAGAVGGGWVYRDFLSSYFPSNELAAARSQIDTLQAQAKTLSEQVAAISGAADQLKSQVGSFATDIQGITEKSSAASTSFETRMAATEAATKTVKAEIEKLKSGISSGGTASTGVDGSALALVAQRLDALEKDVASLKTAKAPPDQTAATATLSQSLSDLKAKIASGASYRDELDRVSRMVPAAAGLDILAAHADEGLPTAAGLAAELTGLIPLLPKQAADTPTTDNSYTDSFWNMMKDVITIRRIGEADWPGLASQCAALAESGDLAQAIEKIDKAEGAKPSVLSGWRDRAAARISLEAASEETSKAVLRQISTMGATP